MRTRALRPGVGIVMTTAAIDEAGLGHPRPYCPTTSRNTLIASLRDDRMETGMVGIEFLGKIAAVENLAGVRTG